MKIQKLSLKPETENALKSVLRFTNLYSKKKKIQFI